jgi:hypothetical protein
VPISDMMFDGDLVRRIEKLERRLTEVTSGRRLEDAAVGARGIRMVGSSLTVVDPTIGQVVVRLGILDDGTTGLVIVDPDTGREVSLSQLAFGMKSDDVTGSGDPGTDWDDLSGSFGPQVTVRVGDSKQLRVSLGATFAGTDADATNSVIEMGFELSGAETLEPGVYGRVIRSTIAGFDSYSVGREFVLNGVGPGLVTVTAKYRLNGATPAARTYGRTLSAQPL